MSSNLISVAQLQDKFNFSEYFFPESLIELQNVFTSTHLVPSLI